jgi:hypothetical protein
MKTIVHVNQHNIRANQKGADRPVLTCKTYKSNRRGNTAVLMVGGVEVGRFVYSPDKPLDCGARVWFETSHKVVVD